MKRLLDSTKEGTDELVPAVNEDCGVLKMIISHPNVG